jgi:squalene-hopene/tetraprenyl-beta-curcumene cyclase
MSLDLDASDLVVPMAERAVASLRGATEHLLGLQTPEGYWRGLLETNVTMDAEDLMLREFLGIRTAEVTEPAARWIRSHQRDDGTWANFYGGPGDLSTTVEAYVALRLAGDAPDAPHMAAAAAFARANGGVASARVFTRIWLALFGLHPWEGLPVLPPEVLYLPSDAPLSIYDFGCWARQTVVAMTIVTTEQPVHPVGFSVSELGGTTPPPAEQASLLSWRGRFLFADRFVRRTEHFARTGIWRRTVREAALLRAEQWIIRRQESDGSWGGIQPPWVYSIIALSLRGYPLDHPVLAKALAGIETFIVHDGEMRWLEACQSPVWDTALALVALSDAGVDTDRPELRRAADWLVAREATEVGDWAVRKSDLAPGGWAFEFANANYPDVDDTAEVVLALRRTPSSDPAAADAAVERAIAWTKGMVSRDGAWGAFDADNILEILYDLPFCDFGAVIDPPSADVTAHALEMLAAEADVPAAFIDGAVDWLRANQERDGAWFGRWGVNYLYGIGAVVPALVAAGVGRDDEMIRRAIAFLAAHQNADGGFGEDIRSYDDPSTRATGTSTASQTAWALLALIAAGEEHAEITTRAVDWLIATQRDDGTWDEPQYTGTGFPRFFYINYHLYRLIFPVAALGRYCAALAVPTSAASGEQERAS